MVTLLGMSMDVKFSQHSKQKSPKVPSPSCSVTEVRLVQYRKHPLPNDVTLPGMLTDVRAWQLSKQ